MSLFTPQVLWRDRINVDGARDAHPALKRSNKFSSFTEKKSLFASQRKKSSLLFTPYLCPSLPTRFSGVIASTQTAPKTVTFRE